MQKDKKQNWLIVCHTWYISSKGFYSKILLNATEKEAKTEALILADEHHDSFCHAKAQEFLLPCIG
jgi:hypothetical protein